MQKPETYRQYAEDCERLAKQLPKHAEALRVMAQAWRQLAGEPNRGTAEGET